MMVNPSTPQMSHDAEIASLATLGMRIRKAVSDGYSVKSPESYDSQFFLDSGPSPMEATSSFQRVPFPEGMSMPPALTSAGSTFQSGLSVSSWGSPSTSNMMTLPSSGVKRRLDGLEDWFPQSCPPKSLPSYDEFCVTDGQLRFDEEF